MKVHEAILISAPVLTSYALTELFIAMPEEKFLEELKRTREAAETFAKKDDSTTSNRVTDDREMVSYAALCSTFHRCLTLLKKMPNNKAVIPVLAETIAWQRAISWYRENI